MQTIPSPVHGVAALSEQSDAVEIDAEIFSAIQERLMALNDPRTVEDILTEEGWRLLRT